MEKGQIGSIKVAWIDGDPGVMHSRMFDDMDEALAFAVGKKEALVFKKTSQKNGQYTWGLLPKLSHRHYKRAIWLKRNKGKIVLLAGVLVLVLLRVMSPGKQVAS